MRLLLLLLILIPTAAFSADPECISGPFHDPIETYPAEDGQIDICVPAKDNGGDLIPAATSIDCLLEVSDGAFGWKPYAVAGSGPGLHVTFSDTEKWE